MSATNRDCVIYVITLDYAQERRDVISARLRQLGIQFEFIPGVDGRKLDPLKDPAYEPMKRQLFWGRDLSNGEFGCVLAHRGVYQHMVKHRTPRAVVLEDDAMPTDEFPAVVRALCDMSHKWDLVRFLGGDKNYSSARLIARLGNTSSKLARPRGIPGGAYGYLLNLHAAERLLAMMQRNWLAADTLLGVTWLTGLKTLSVVPSPVLPNEAIPSCIDEQDTSRRWDKRNHLTGWKKQVYPVTRLAWKLYLNACNACVSARTWPADRRMRASTGAPTRRL